MEKYNKKTFTISIVLLAVFNLTNSCTTKKSSPSEKDKQISKSKKGITNENFETFYKAFYNDSLFQISRITFPLKGFNSDEYDSELGKNNPPYFWKKEEWTFLNTLPQDYVKYDKKEWIEEYKKEIKHNKDLSVLEKIYMVDSGNIEERIFKIIKNKWYLVYYSYKNF